jgi:hypothetical protein
MLQEFVFTAPQGGGEPKPHADGVRLDRAYEVQLPAGVQIVRYVEAEAADTAGGAAELLGMWVDPAVTKHRQGLGFLFPLRADARSALRQLAEEAFHHRRYEHHQSRRALGLTRESLYLKGDFAVFYVEGDNPRGAYERFAESTSVHDVWLRSQLRELLQEGFDLDAPLPPIRTLHDRDVSAVPA